MTQQQAGATDTLGAAMQIEGGRLYRVKAVADMLDVSPATIYRAVESGALPAVRIGTGKGAVRISGEGIESYLAACQLAAIGPAKAGSPTDDVYATGEAA